MPHRVYLQPSLYAHTLNGILMFLAAIVLIKHYRTIQNLDSYRLILILLVLSIAAGVHSLSHLGLEAVYGYNPLYVFQ